jgi:hypothetical protein
MRTTFQNHHQSNFKKPTIMNPTPNRSLLGAVCLGLFGLMATTAQAGDTTEQPIKPLNEASDLIHWPEGFSPKQTDAFVHNQIFINAPAKVIWSNLVHATGQVGTPIRPMSK